MNAMPAKNVAFLFGPFASFERMAELFRYPDERYVDRVRSAYEHLLEEDREAADELKPFLERIEAWELGTIEQLYQASFDIQAITTLDISYVLFGDDYKRGQMLSYLQRDQRALGIDPGTELPDHLSNILRTIAHMKDDLLREDLVRKALLPALEQIIEDFGEERMQQKRKLYRKYHRGILETPEGTRKLFLHPLRALKGMLERTLGPVEEEEENLLVSKGFIGNLDHEIAVEHTRSSSF